MSSKSVKKQVVLFVARSSKIFSERYSNVTCFLQKGSSASYQHFLTACKPALSYATNWSPAVIRPDNFLNRSRQPDSVIVPPDDRKPKTRKNLFKNIIRPPLLSERPADFFYNTCTQFDILFIRKPRNPI